jgi:hypothetical protein
MTNNCNTLKVNTSTTELPWRTSFWRILLNESSLMLRPTVSRPCNKAPIWGLRPDLYYCQTVAGLLMWGALSDERTGLSSTIAAGPRRRSHSRVGVPWDSRPYFTVSDSRLPFCRLLRLAGLRWRYSTPPPHGISQTSLLLIWGRGGQHR